jgi:hypothetical protein
VSKPIRILAEAAADIQRGIAFYDSIEQGAGDHFRDTLLADIRRLGSYFGEPNYQAGCFRMLASRFPFAIFFRDHSECRQVVAVLDLRRNPAWLLRQLDRR